MLRAAIRRKRWVCQYLGWMCRPLRGQARSHRDCGRPRDWRSQKIRIVGAGLLRAAIRRKRWVCQYLGWMCRPLRGQARSHRDCGRPRDWCSQKIRIVGAGLLAKAVGRPISLLNVPASTRASPLPQGLWPAAELVVTEDQNCGSELARDSAGSGNISVECAGLFASRLAPTGIVASRRIGGHCRSNLWERACSR